MDPTPTALSRRRQRSGDSAQLLPSGAQQQDDEPKEFIPALKFRFLTRFYDTVVAWTCRESAFKAALVAQAMSAHADPPTMRHPSVLDLGCGTGTLALLIEQHRSRPEVTGLDADEDVLELARRKATSGGRTTFVQGFGQRLPFPDASFDRVLSSLFFHHLSTDVKKATLVEALRVLKPGGELHIADWGAPANLLMRGLFLFVQLLDGFATTADNVNGLLPPFMLEAGFAQAIETRRFSTVFGTLCLYSACKRG